jgi:hypothetical protein
LFLMSSNKLSILLNLFSSASNGLLILYQF